MIRLIIKPTKKKYLIELPEEYMNKEVEVIVFPLQSYDNKGKIKNDIGQLMKKTMGILAKRNIDPLQWQKEIRNEYER
jgi:hypothetical protein